MSRKPRVESLPYIHFVVVRLCRRDNFRGRIKYSRLFATSPRCVFFWLVRFSSFRFIDVLTEHKHKHKKKAYIYVAAVLTSV